MSDWYRDIGHYSEAVQYATRAAAAARLLHGGTSDVVTATEARVVTLRDKAAANPTPTISSSIRLPMITDQCDVCTSMNHWSLGADDAGVRHRVKITKCRCGIARYCGTVCQREAWPAHKVLHQ